MNKSSILARVFGLIAIGVATVAATLQTANAGGPLNLTGVRCVPGDTIIIPEAVKVNRDNDVALPLITRQFAINTLSAGNTRNLFDAPPCLEGQYYAGFQLYYDLGDKTTQVNWTSVLEVAFLHDDDTLWKEPLQVDMPTQTFIATRFHDVPVACADDYRFVIKRKTITGAAPQGNIYLKVLLYRAWDAVFNPSSPLQLNYAYSAGEASVSWSYSGNGAVAYDVEWVFIDDYDNFSGTAQQAFSFKRAVRISTAASYYKHLAYYPQGRLWYRARAIGYNPQYPDHRINGQWFYGAGIALTIANQAPDKNWQRQTSYSEEGKYKVATAYFDGSLRKRQVLTNLSSENLTLVEESLYDFEGRKVVDVLPVPAADASLAYKSAFHQFQTTDPTVAAHTSAIRQKFHYDNYRLPGSILTNQVGAGKYYSPANTSSGIYRNYLPDAEGFAYSQTEFMRDGTGLSNREAGVGKLFAIDGAHAVRHYYGTAAPAELIRLFGSNAGIANHYTKKLIVDANGQVNVTYVDQQDHIVAKALAGDKPGNVDALASYANLPTAQTKVDISNNNVRANGVSKTNHKLLNVAPNTNYTFRYDVSSLGTELGTIGCQSCSYDFTIVITDPDGKPLSLSGAPGNQSTDPTRYERRNISSADCQNPQLNTVEFTIPLAEIGDYTITKTLTPHELTYDELVNLVTQDVDILLKIDDIYNSYVVDPSDCEICTSCPAADSVINQAIEETTDLDCENTYQRIIQYYRDKYGDANDTPYEVPQDSIEAHPLYCQYQLCVKNRDSDIFEKQISRVNDWPTAVGRGYNNLINLDPFFNTSGLSGTGYKTSMQNKLNDVFVATVAYDANGDGVQDGTRTYRGTIAQVTDPANTNYYVDQNGNLNSGGRHLLYLDLMGRRSQLTTQAYQAELDAQRWTLYKSFYLEAKRKTKLEIGEYQSCDSARAALELNDELPQTPETIAEWGEDNGATGPVSRPELEMSISNLAFNCNTKFSAADSTAIGNHLEAYFNSNPRNMFRLILRADLGSNSHLIAIQNILNSYSCSLTTVALDDPLTCAAEEENWVVNPLLTPTGSGCSPDITSACYPGWAKATGTPNTDVGGGQGRFFIWAFPQNVTSEAIRGSFIRPLEVGVKYEMCFKYAVEHDGTTYTSGQADQVYVQLSRSSGFINAQGTGVTTSAVSTLARLAQDTVFAGSRQSARAQAAACILPGAQFPDPVIINGQTVGMDKIWNGQGLSNTTVYKDTCIVFEPTQASTYFYFSIMSCNANVYQGINIRDLVVKKVSAHPNTIEFEGETVCLNYDTANTTLKGFSFKVDWNKEVEKCLDRAEQENSFLIDYAIEKLITEEATKYNALYQSQCMAGITEQLSYTYQPKEYHYTLFYYDQAGNLVQTVAPRGVNPLSTTQVNNFLAGNRVEPVHTGTTTYRHNALNQIIVQKTPDAGESRFWYDNKGKLRLSQHAQQAKENKYFYTRYDEQGRTIEIGELQTTTPLATLLVQAETPDFPSAQVYTLTDVTRTHYDFSTTQPGLGLVQEYLRTRISYVEVFEKNHTDTIATYYSYDIHGNVKAVAQKLPGLKNKRVDYRYDLINSNITHTFYQYGGKDQFSHRYRYDSDNRIISVETSTDRFIWNHEAAYTYYAHGSLARTTLGEHTVQAQDYYYTLQGWIKGVNMPYQGDPGNDGAANSAIGKDVMAYTLGYFDGDYRAISSTTVISDSRDRVWTRLQENLGHTGLYNGNLAWSVIDLAKIGDQQNDRTKGMQAVMYQYDQLHRVVKGRALTSYTAAAGFGTRAATPSAYDEDFAYDANGNFLTLTRRDGAGAIKNDYQFKYYGPTNKLKEVLPVLRDTTYASGAIVENHKIYRNITIQGSAYLPAGSTTKLDASENFYINPDFHAGNNVDFFAHVLDDNEGTFMYDAIGNLVADQDKGIRIQWTPYGKVREVRSKIDSVVLQFRYDAAGNRIEKTLVSPDTTYTLHYVRDAKGNVVSIYSDTLVIEQSIQGKTRIGTYAGRTKEGKAVFGKRRYELTNHIGNILAVVSDRVNMASGSVTATVVSASDYYAFGSTMQGRSFMDDSYRYGYSGKEKDTGKEFVYTVYDYGNRIYNPDIGRFLSVDPEFQELPGVSAYAYSLNNPLVYKDQDGKLPIIPLLLKAGAAGAADMLTQAAMAYFFDPEVETIGEAFDKVNWVQVGRSALEGLIPWRTPGGKFGKAAATAAGDVLVNAISEGSNYSGEKALTDFATGFISDLAGGQLAELVSKYGTKAIARGLSKMGFDDKMIEKYLTGAGTTWKGPVDYTSVPDPRKPAVGKEFTPTHKRNLKAHNQRVNNGYLRSDQDGTFLNPATRGGSDPLQAEVDHVRAKTRGGSNHSVNAQILSKRQNLTKSNH